MADHKTIAEKLNQPVLHMCGICTYLYPLESLHVFRHDEIAEVIKGDGGNVQIQTKTYRCNRCEEGLNPLPLGRNGQF